MGQNGSVIDLQEMLADLELLVNTESTSLHLDLLDDGLPGQAPLVADASLRAAAEVGVTDVVAIGVDPRMSSSSRWTVGTAGMVQANAMAASIVDAPI